MTRAALNLILDLRESGHSVRRDDEAGYPRIMIAPPPTNNVVVQAIKDNREAILAALIPGWPVEETEALAFWLAWNRAVDARPQEVADRRLARTKGRKQDAAALLPQDEDEEGDVMP